MNWLKDDEEMQEELNDMIILLGADVVTHLLLAAMEKEALGLHEEAIIHEYIPVIREAARKLVDIRINRCTNALGISD